jgi:uncharacterized membrane protein
MMFNPLNTWVDLLESILMIVIGLFGLYQGLSAAWSVLKGDPLKDERIRKIHIKASSIAFRISIWGWIGLTIANRHMIKLQTDIMEAGILMMGGAYVISVAVINIRGLGDE